MLGFAELLEIDAYGPLNQEQREAAANIIENANYLTDVVNDLLDEAQIEAGMILLENAPFSPCDVLAEVKATIEVLTARKGLRLICVCAPEVPAAMNGDAKRFRQVLMNLAGNAVKFTREGEVRMQFFCPSPDEMVIRVSDTGAGIPPEARDYIFSAFRQVDNRITRENRGSGLGLSISRQLVELMGGRIALESEVGRGSTFTITLPIRRGAEGIQ
jgi:signal transduction histidine kinase